MENQSGKQTFSELVDQVNQSSHLNRIDNDDLYFQISNLIEGNSKNLNGELNFYCVYENIEEHHKYALVHGFYNESNLITENNIDEKTLEDAKLIHQKLKETKIEIDYFFIMPYFDYQDRKKTSFLAQVLTTNSLPE